MFIYVYLFVINGIGGDNAAQVKYGLHVTFYANLNFPVMPQRGPCFVSPCLTFCCLCLEENINASGTDVQDKFPSGDMKVFFFSLSLHLNYLDIYLFIYFVWNASATFFLYSWDPEQRMRRIKCHEKMRLLNSDEEEVPSMVFHCNYWDCSCRLGCTYNVSWPVTLRRYGRMNRKHLMHERQCQQMLQQLFFRCFLH